MGSDRYTWELRCDSGGSRSSGVLCEEHRTKLTCRECDAAPSEVEAERLRVELEALVAGLNNRLCFGDCLSPRADVTGHDVDCPEGRARRALLSGPWETK